MKMNCDEQPDVMEVAVQEPEFEPYAAVFTDTDGTQEIIKVVSEGGYGLGDDSHTLYNKRAVKRIANPGIALKILIKLHGNPALDAVLDELKRIINFSTTVRGFNDTWISKSDIIDQIASLRKGPADTVDILDEAFIRKQERENVIEKARKHVDLNPQLSLGTVYRDDLQRFLLDTLKGGE